MMTLPILDKNGKQKDQVELPEAIFGNKVNTYVIHQAIVMYQACLRQGTASTKERGAVSGGGKKPWRQKGTGRARQGSIRSPLWHGGGVVFGPHPRDFGYSVPLKVRKAALRESLNAKYQAQDLLCLDDLKDKFTKTKEVAGMLTALNVKGKTLAIFDGCDKSIHLAGRNIARISIKRALDVNAYDIMRNRTLLLTRTALVTLLGRLQK